MRCEAWPDFLPGGMRASSVYFGGGTPSLWKPSCVARVLEALQKKLGFEEDIEITLEANPQAAQAAKLREFRAAGANRLSLGIQSLDDGMLRLLGRKHSAKEAKEAALTAREAGFENLSLDFIYAMPGQTLQQARADALEAVALQPSHLSLYALTLDAEALSQPVPMAKQRPQLPSEALSIAMRADMARTAQEAGLCRYELSNYALAGKASVHNLSYWKGGDYMGLGAGAVGAFMRGGEGQRWFNHRLWEDYAAALASGALPEAEREFLSPQTLRVERALLGLRLVEGVSPEVLHAASGKPAQEVEALVRSWEAEGLAVYASGRWRLSEKGMDLHSALCLQLL